MNETKTTLPVTSSASVHLDALRGAAALLVFANHTRALYFDSPIGSQPAQSQAVTLQPVDTVAPNSTANLVGAEGIGSIRIASAAVIVFFVLSGYLVGGSVLRSMRKNRWSWRNYLTKRLVRLLIVLIPALVIGAALDHMGQRITGAGSVYTAPAGLHLTVAAALKERSSFKVFLGNLLFLQNITVPIAGTNVALWSLANEFWYYLIFPLAACAFFPLVNRVWRVLSLVLAGAVLMFVGVRIAELFPIWLMGAGVSLAPRKLVGPKLKLLTWVALVSLLVSIGTVRALNMNAVEAEYIIGIFTSVLLYCIVGHTWAWPSTSTLRPMGVYERSSKFLSHVSYSLYLFHLPIAVFLCALVNSPWHPLPTEPKSIAWYVGSDLFILAVVYLLWLAFESRTDRLRTRIFGLEHQLSNPPASAGPVGSLR